MPLFDRQRQQPRHAAPARGRRSRRPLTPAAAVPAPGTAGPGARLPRRPAFAGRVVRLCSARPALSVAAITVAGLAVAAGLTSVLGPTADQLSAGARSGPAGGSHPARHLAGQAAADAAAAARVRAGQQTRARTVRAAPGRTDRPVPAASGAPSRAAASPDPSSSSSGQQAAHRRPYLIYDSVIPTAIPPGVQVATYADGVHPTPASAVAGRRRVLWIDVTGGDPAAQVLDVEPGCASPSVAASWADRRLSTHPGATAIIYTTIGQWAIVKADIGALPAAMQARVRWWIADPTGVPHLVPGSQATQWYWGPRYDISTATSQF